MRRAILLLCACITLLAAAAHLYRDSRVRDLFRSGDAAPGAKRREARITTAPAPVQPVPSKVPGPSTPARPAPTKADEAAPVEIIRSPNDMVSRVLLSVLRAGNLAAGISLEVTNESILVFGEARSAEDREAVVRLLRKGSEGRRVEAAGLIVRN